MVLSRVDERLEEISDLLSDSIKEEIRAISSRKLWLNVIEFLNDSSLKDNEKKEFWARFEKLLRPENGLISNI